MGGVVAGRSICLFLVDGVPHGMRTAENGNWTGLALVCPPTGLARLAQRPEVKKTGIDMKGELIPYKELEARQVAPEGE